MAACQRCGALGEGTLWGSAPLRRTQATNCLAEGSSVQGVSGIEVLKGWGKVTQISIELDWETAILKWEEVTQLESQVQWGKGDIALNLKPVYGDSTLERFAEEVDADYGRLRHYKATAQAFESARRCADLSYGHHEVLTAREDRLEWLKRAADAAPKWSRARMLEEIATADAQKEKEEGERRDRERLIEAAADLALQVDAGELSTAEAMAEFSQRERQKNQEQEDHRGQMRRCRDRISQLHIGWLEVVSFEKKSTVDREEILDGLSEDVRNDFLKIMEIMEFYNKRGTIDGTSTQSKFEYSNQIGLERKAS